MKQLTIAIAVVLLSASLPATAISDDAPPHKGARLLFDFEKNALSDDWSAVRQIEAARVDTPKFDGEERHAPDGRGLAVETVGGSGIFAKSGRVPGNWRGFSELSFWVHRSPEEVEKRPKSVLEMQIYESDGKARFWRKIELSHKGWKRIEIPLRWCRYGSGGRVPRWDKVDRVGLWFRDAAKVTIDAITVTEGAPNTAAFVSIDELLRIAFPDATADGVALAKREDAIVLTDAAELDADKLGDHLAKAAAMLRAELPFLPKVERPPVMIVFATQESYREFTPRYAARFASAAARPTAGGYTLHGVCTSYWDKELGTLRPVYAHEYIHGLLGETARLNHSGDWLQEGLATVIQLRLAPQKNLPELVRDGLADSEKHLPLEKLCSGARIPLNRYWQAVTVVEMLLADGAFKARLPDLFAAIHSSGSTDLGPHLKTVFESDWDAFRARWKRFCEKKYAK